MFTSYIHKNDPAWKTIEYRHGKQGLSFAFELNSIKYKIKL